MSRNTNFSLPLGPTVHELFGTPHSPHKSGSSGSQFSGTAGTASFLTDALTATGSNPRISGVSLELQKVTGKTMHGQAKSSVVLVPLSFTSTESVQFSSQPDHTNSYPSRFTVAIAEILDVKTILKTHGIGCRTIERKG